MLNSFSVSIANDTVIRGFDGLFVFFIRRYCGNMLINSHNVPYIVALPQTIPAEVSRYLELCRLWQHLKQHIWCWRMKSAPFLLYFKVSEAAFRYYTHCFPHALWRLERKPQHPRVMLRHADRNIIQQVAVEEKNIDMCFLEAAAVCSQQPESNQYKTKVRWFRFTSDWIPPLRSEHFIGIFDLSSFAPCGFFWHLIFLFLFFIIFLAACQHYWHDHDSSPWTSVVPLGRLLCATSPGKTDSNFQMAHYYDLSSFQQFA